MTKSLALSATSFLIFAVGLWGCKSSQSTSTAIYPMEDAGTVSSYIAANPLQAMVDNYKDWTDVSVPVTLRLTSPHAMSISARAKMVRGRCIDFSFRMLGFEVARVWISSDSVVAASRPKKIYLSESLSQLTSDIPLNIENLQDMLIGRPFILGGSTVALSDSSTVYMEEFGSSQRLLPKHQPYLAEYGFVLDLPGVITALAVTAPAEDVALTVAYSGPRPLTVAGNVMDDVALSLDTQKGDYGAAVSWKWGRARWNEGSVVLPPSTEGLQRVRAAELLKIVKNL